MQLTINQSSSWLSVNLFKPFLLVGTGGLSIASFYGPISSQNQELKKKIDKAILPFSPLANMATQGSKNLFETLGNWTKTSSNIAEKVKNHAFLIAQGNLANGTKHIFTTLKSWGDKAYDFLKSLINKDIWEKLKKNIPHLRNFFNLLKNVMKAEINENTSIFNQLFEAAGKDGFNEFVGAMGELADKQPELFGQMTDEDVKNLAHSLNENPKETTEMIQKFAEKDSGSAKKDELFDALQPSILIGRIKSALEKAEGFKGKESLKEEEKKQAKEIFDELQDLSQKLSTLIEKSKKLK